jgi:hypothetical protein
MARETSKEEIEALIKATEQARVRLQESWKKVEDLQGAIESSKDAQTRSQAHLSNKKPKR